MSKNNPADLLSQIRKCDTDHPYAFISYSHRDCEHVWEEVIAFQKMGYNIWIDKNVSPTEERSWDEKTAELIHATNCKMVIFYTSKDSVISRPCYHELAACSSVNAQKAHNKNNVPLIKADVEPISDLHEFRMNVYHQIDHNPNLPGSKKTEYTTVLSDVFDLAFPSENSTVRMLSRHDTSRESDYYQQMETCFRETGVKKFTADDAYLNCVKLLQDPAQYRNTLQLLQESADQNHTCSSLLLAYILKTGICGRQNHAKAENLLWFESLKAGQSSWKDMAEEKKRQGKREEAIALYLAHGMTAKNVEAFYSACKLWLNISAPNYEFAKQSLLDARALGSPDAQERLRGLEAYKKKYLQKT